MTARYGDRQVSDDTAVLVDRLDELIVELRRIADAAMPPTMSVVFPMLCTFKLRSGLPCGLPEDSPVHPGPDERMGHGKHVFRVETSRRPAAMDAQWRYLAATPVSDDTEGAG